MDTYTLINRNGSREERPFLMREIDGHQVPYVSAHITKREVDDAWTGKVILAEPIIALFERARQIHGAPIGINSGYRTPAYQKYLKEIGMRAASDSPHCRGGALDLAVPRGVSMADFLALFRRAASDLDLPTPRFGHKLYNDGFLHVDLVFLVFRPYANGVDNPHPEAWRPGVEW